MSDLRVCPTWGSSLLSYGSLSPCLVIIERMSDAVEVKSQIDSLQKYTAQENRPNALAIFGHQGSGPKRIALVEMGPLGSGLRDGRTGFD